VFAREHLWLALAFGVWIAVFCAAATWFAVLRMKRDVVVAQKDSAVGGIFADSFSNEATVKSFAKERDEQKRFDDVTEDCYQYRKDTWLFGMALKRFQIFIMSIFEVVLVLVLVQGWRDGTVTAGDFVFFQTYVLLLMYHMRDIGNELHRVFRNLAEAKEMAEIYEREPEVQDAPGARPLIVENGRIEFYAVNFSYNDCEGREHHDLEDFKLLVESGEMIAIIGHSGAGKSTIVKLTGRGYDLNSGYIRIDGQDIANVTQVSLRQQIAVVPQQPDLFHRSLRDNIAFARPDASEEEIIIAAKRAHAWEFIERLPEGLNTLVGERGVKLSGGERQRIALARAFLADAPILILDEATSALDSKTEQKIQSAIADLLEGRTCIVIAHRLSTILHADRIIVMEGGSIVEEGTHQELLDQNGVYADLWNHQSGGYLND
jgi:ATP-binding cassette subfamily B protein